MRCRANLARRDAVRERLRGVTDGVVIRTAAPLRFENYLGTHRGRWLEDDQFHGIPLFVTYNTLSAYQRHGDDFPKGVATDLRLTPGRTRRSAAMASGATRPTSTAGGCRILTSNAARMSYATSQRRCTVAPYNPAADWIFPTSGIATLMTFVSSRTAVWYSCSSICCTACWQSALA